MTIDQKVDEYRLKLTKLRQEHPQIFERMRCYMNGAIGVPSGDYLPDPENDRVYLDTELRLLCAEHKEYCYMANQLYSGLLRR